MFTKPWFYITSPSHHNHVLTVADASFESQARVELRPNVQGTHQQWYMDRFGFLINKHSGCVLAVKTVTKRKSIQGQSIIQARRKDIKDAKGQQWQCIQSTETNHIEQAGDQENSADGISCSDYYYLQLNGFSDFYLDDKDVPTFGDNKVKWAIVC